jgi:phytoene/squalene synthetase
MSDRRRTNTTLGLYTSTASDASGTVIRRYSTSFGAAARMLEPGIRRRIRDIYALVRIADEIVDGAAAEAGLAADELLDILDELERETETAMRRGYSANIIVHAFAVTARECGIEPSLTRPFFASMRRDLDDSPFTAEEIGPYIHGSAEVVGLMCLRAFFAGETIEPARRAALDEGAIHLGAAFQKVNFLRDAAVDYRTLGRNYFPWLDPTRMTDAEKHAILDDIDADLRIAADSLPLLPRSARPAVTAAHGLFRRLSTKLRRTPAAELLTRRVRVPDSEKLIIAARSALGGRP